MDNNERRNFGSLLRQEIANDLAAGFGRVVPWLGITCAAVAGAAAYFVVPEFFQKGQWGTLAGVYAGIVTFNGITLALTWSAISKVYDTVSKPEFSRFLRASGLLNTYLFYVSLIHSVQVVGATTAVLALVSIFEPLPHWAERALFGCTIATTLYAIRWAAGSARVVKDLAWNYATFDELSEEDRHKLFVVSGAG